MNFFKTFPSECENQQPKIDLNSFQWKDEIQELLDSWQSILPTAPSEFIQTILINRGYNSKMIYIEPFRSEPTHQQILDYDKDTLIAIRESNLSRLESNVAAERSMSACNKYSESLLHLACRRSNYSTVAFLLQHGADPLVVDDFGRTPLHDACWRGDLAFDIITIILDYQISKIEELKINTTTGNVSKSPNFHLTRSISSPTTPFTCLSQLSSPFLLMDVRGHSPLDYVRPEFWPHWCAYLYLIKDRYWPKKTLLVPYSLPPSPPPHHFFDKSKLLSLTSLPIYQTIPPSPPSPPTPPPSPPPPPPLLSDPFPPFLLGSDFPTEELAWKDELMRNLSEDLVSSGGKRKLITTPRVVSPLQRKRGVSSKLFKGEITP